MSSHHLTRERCRQVVERTARSVADYCIDDNILTLIIGESGGLDSAVSTGVAVRASELVEQLANRPLIVVGATLPCFSSDESLKLAKEVIETFGVRHINADLTMDFYDLVESSPSSKDGTINELDRQAKAILEETGLTQPLDNWEWTKRVAHGNIKARLRMMALYHLAQRMQGMVISTDNLSEYWMGFWTICGDVGDYCVIQQVLKGLELYDIARYLGVPQGIIDAKPDDGLGIANGDEDQLGAPYEVIDRIMIKLIQAGFDTEGSKSQLNNLPVLANEDPELVMSLAKRCLNTAFKRRGTVVLTREEQGLPPVADLRF